MKLPLLIGLSLLLALSACSPSEEAPTAIEERFSWPAGTATVSGILLSEVSVVHPTPPRTGLAPTAWSWVIMAFAAAAGAVLLARRTWLRSLRPVGAAADNNAPAPADWIGRAGTAFRNMFHRKKPAEPDDSNEEEPFYY